MPSQRPRAAASIRDHWPLLLAVGLVLWGYFDLKADVRELRATLEARGPAARAPAARGDGGATQGDGPPATGEPARAPARRAGAGPGPGPGSEVSDAGWRCAGRISQRMVRHVLGRHGEEVFACHRASRGAEPLAGVLHLRIRVGPEGGVEGVRMEGIEDDGLRQCVGESVRAWRFPPPAGGRCAVVFAPFALGSGPDAEPGRDPSSDG